MLAGLLFAIEEALQPAGRLVATLPFAGTTLIEHQARQLVAAGATQVVVIGDRLAPDLAGAVHRIGRRGVAVDPVASVAEAAAVLHPLARLLVLADGLIAADATVAALAAEGGEALLVTTGADALPTFERIGGASAWAGVARLDPRRLAEVAALPVDYAPQSTLLRVAEAAGATRVALPPQALADGHGIERTAAAIEGRGRRLVAAVATARHGWFDRFLAAPLARAAMPVLVGAGVAGTLVAILALAAGLLGAVALVAGWPRTGMVLALVATLGCVLAEALSVLREERPFGAVAAAATVGVPYASVLLLGWTAASARGDAVPEVLAVVLVGLALLGQRAIRRVIRWWGSPPAYLVTATVPTLFGWPTAGLALAAGYAGATLAAAVERLRAPAGRDA